MKARKATKKATAEKAVAKSETKVTLEPAVTVQITGPKAVCDAAVLLMREVFAALGYRTTGAVERTPLAPAPANTPAPKAEKPKKPTGRPVTKAEIRQWKAWRKKGASFGEIARRAGRPRSVVTKHVQARDTGAKCDKVLK